MNVPKFTKNTNVERNQKARLESKMFSRTSIFLLAVATLSVIQPSEAGQYASWFYRGAEARNGTVLALNKFDTFILLCKAKPYTITPSNRATVFVVSKSKGLDSYSFTSASSTADQDGMKFTARTSGTLVYDSINGPSTGFDHFIMIPVVPTTERETIRVGTLQMFIPIVQAVDAGSYFCSYVDGSNDGTAPANTFAVSGSFTLTVNTKADSRSRKLATSIMFAYAAALIGSAKVFL